MAKNIDESAYRELVRRKIASMPTRDIGPMAWRAIDICKSIENDGFNHPCAKALIDEELQEIKGDPIR